MANLLRTVPATAKRGSTVASPFEITAVKTSVLYCTF
jgi:hypothetical protein